MAHAVVADHPPGHMGLPLPNGKLAMWLFLVTEIMFFTALIGTYMILRNGTPTAAEPWPKPHDVHLVEALGAINTFVLICSSVSVVLAHWALGRKKVGQAVIYVTITLALGTLFRRRPGRTVVVCRIAIGILVLYLLWYRPLRFVRRLPAMGWHPRLKHPDLTTLRAFRISGFEKIVVLYRFSSK